MKIYLLVLLILITACAESDQTAQPELEAQNQESASWQTITLADVNSGEEFTLSEFDQPVLLESFAVWCPTCTKQQKILKEYKETRTDFVSVSLNTDPNEDETLVREHAQSNGFDWRYAVSPAELTSSLIDEFGFQVVNAPAVPIVLLCPDDSTDLVAGGVKDVEELDDLLMSCDI